MKFVSKLPDRKRGPLPPGQQAKYQADADKLRAKPIPMRWALWKSYNADQARSLAAMAADVKTGTYAAFRPAGDFEAATRKQGDKVNVYVRYVG